MDTLDPPIDRAALDAHIARVCDDLGRAETGDDGAGWNCYTSCSRLIEAMRYIVGSGGKRFRAALCVGAYRYAKSASASAIQGSGGIDCLLPADVLRACSAVEMIHAASLAIDDLPCMDDADIRRSAPCVHRVYGESVSVLAATALMVRAVRATLLPLREAKGGEAKGGEAKGGEAKGGEAKGDDDGEGDAASIRRRVSTCAELMVAAERMAMGQVSDLELAAVAGPSADPGTTDRVRSAHAGKTGALIAASAIVGAICAGCSSEADGEVLGEMRRYGSRLGMAYQIVDDIIDATASKRDAGKPTGADRGANSFVAVAGLDAARAEASKLVDQAIAELRSSKDPGDLARIARSILSSNAAIPAPVDAYI
jgi:geranylgeranyl pyrophosphate synthase